MTREEFKNVVRGLKAIYSEPNFIATQASFEIWYMSLSDLSYQECTVAAQRYIQTGHYPPKPADIRDLAKKSTERPLDDWGAGWQETMAAIRRYGYPREQDALASMSELTRETVQRLGYQTLCMSEDLDKDRANFRMIYNELVERRNSENVLSPQLRDLIGKMWDRGDKQVEQKESKRLETATG